MLVSTLLLASKALAADSGGWNTGRSTFYGNPGDGASIHGGSCEFYELNGGNNGQGYFITALSDLDPDFQGGCGRCYEVACVNGEVRDGYGNVMDRSTACLDETKSIFVKVTDTCPCYYPSNAYSNRRWCCADNGVRHLDMSFLAFQKLAPMAVGVMGVKFRPVPCDVWSAGTGEAQPILDATPFNGSTNAVTAAAAGPSPASPSTSGSVVVLAGSGPLNGWHDASWSVESSWTAPSGSRCTRVSPGGAFSLGPSASGIFAGLDALHYEVDDALSTPGAFRVQVTGSAGLATPEQPLSAGAGIFGLAGLLDRTRAADYRAVAFVNRNAQPETLCLREVQVVSS